MVGDASYVTLEIGLRMHARVAYINWITQVWVRKPPTCTPRHIDGASVVLARGLLRGLNGDRENDTQYLSGTTIKIPERVYTSKVMGMRDECLACCMRQIY